ncbi:hypothetical protein ACGFOU_32310 [Streptomyces sp. NPDC048595]|uniref:hypothetical protein n=1 Tax=Streptomyces sp. NPDC048595 TaxID=3365576 RepID=UPI003712B44A
MSHLFPKETDVSTARNHRRRCLPALALAAGAFAAFQIAGAPMAQAAAAPHAPTRAGTSAVKAGEVIVCQDVQVEGPNVFARSCDSSSWGPLSDFVVRGDNAAYQCQTGWAEGSLWVQGQNCRQIPSAG